MQNTGSLKVTTAGDREVVLTRVFDAPRELVFEAMTKPELVKRWLTGPPGWTPSGRSSAAARWRRRFTSNTC